MTKPFTEQDQKEYLENDGEVCPICGCDDLQVEPDSRDYLSGYYKQIKKCTRCEAVFMETYTLVAVERLD
jgi:hypothetical protein